LKKLCYLTILWIKDFISHKNKTNHSMINVKFQTCINHKLLCLCFEENIFVICLFISVLVYYKYNERYEMPHYKKQFIHINKENSSQ